MHSLAFLAKVYFRPAALWIWDCSNTHVYCLASAVAASPARGHRRSGEDGPVSHVSRPSRLSRSSHYLHYRLLDTCRLRPLLAAFQASSWSLVPC